MWDKIWNQVYDLATLPVLCLLLSCILSLVYWNRLPLVLKTLAVFLFFNFLIEIGARFASIMFRQNLPLLHLYTIGEILLLSLFYKQILGEHSIFRRKFNWILGTAIGLVVLNTIFVQGIFQFNSYAKTLVQVIIILFAIDYLFRISSLEDSASILHKSIRLINAAILLYYSGSLFIFMASHFEVEMRGAFKILWNINAVLNLVFQIMILIALWKVIFNPQKSFSSQAQVS